MHCKYFSFIHWDLFFFFCLVFFSLLQKVQTGRVTKQKCLRSVISCLILAEAVWEEEKRSHVSFKYSSLERSFKQMALETLGL